MLSSQKNIVLFGFMGTGKTAVARRLGKKLGWRVVEMDEVIEEEEGISISRIFTEKGENYFRRQERNLVRRLAEGSGAIIAAGGGVVLDPDNVSDFQKNGILFCLAARPEVIEQRLANESHRPLLEVADRLNAIKARLKQRQPFYEPIEHQIDTSDLSVEEVAGKIMAIALKY